MSSSPLDPSPDGSRLLADRHPTPLWRARLDAERDYVNQAWLDFTGRRPEDELGGGWADAVHPDDRAACLERYREHIAEGTAFVLEYRVKRHDGTFRYCSDSGAPFHDERGAVIGFLGSRVDVHQQVTAARARPSLLSMIAHELRTPVTSLGLWQEMLRRELARGLPVSEAALEKVGLQIERLSTLVRDLGDVAALEAGRVLQLGEVREVDLAEVVRATVPRFERSSRARAEARPAHSFSVSVKEVDGPFVLLGDRYRLVQVLESLLDNAVKYSPRGGAVELRLERVGHEVTLTVRDEGIGIPPAEVACVSDRYFRASNVSPGEYSGIGMGLALAKEALALHHGRLSLTSAPGAGATVVVTLPARGQS